MGSEDGWDGRSVGGKWRQLYLNNNKKCGKNKIKLGYKEKKILKSIMVWLYKYEYTKTHCIVHFKGVSVWYVNCILKTLLLIKKRMKGGRDRGRKEGREGGRRGRKEKKDRKKKRERERKEIPHWPT